MFQVILESWDVTIKASKTDPFRKGIKLFLGKIASDLCLVTAMLTAMLAYMVSKKSRDRKSVV